ncbi:MAG TPA: hypothetical protein ENL32_01715 [Methanomicrobia archaeon]|nr:hypothetical protein [Methanomicrobia archaeon]
MALKREELMKRLKLSQEEIEKTADKIVNEYRTGKLVKMELREEDITEKILENQNILIFGPQTVGKSVFTKQLILNSIETGKKCVYISKNIYKIKKTELLLKRDISRYSNLFLIEVPERGELFFLPLDILQAGLELKNIEFIIFDSMTHLSFTTNFFMFFEKYLKKITKMNIKTALSLTETYETRHVIERLKYLFDCHIKFNYNNTVEVNAENIGDKMYKFSVVKQKVVFEKEIEKIESKYRSPRDIIKGR